MRFDQVKILAEDATALAAFYEDALDFRLIAPIANFSDEILARGIGAPGAKLRMAWLSFPGSSDGGPILELYQLVDWDGSWAYRPGQGHIALEVDNVPATAGRVIGAGGSQLGEVVDWNAPSGNLVRFVFMCDPERNVVDLWGRL